MRARSGHGKIASVSLILARGLQILGLLYLPIGLYRGLTSDDLRGEMVFLAIGALLFLAGRYIEARGRRV